MQRSATARPRTTLDPMRYAVLLVVALAFCSAAQGSFPGANGRIVFMRAGTRRPGVVPRRCRPGDRIAAGARPRRGARLLADRREARVRAERDGVRRRRGRQRRDGRRRGRVPGVVARRRPPRRLALHRRRHAARRSRPHGRLGRAADGSRGSARRCPHGRPTARRSRSRRRLGSPRSLPRAGPRHRSRSESRRAAAHRGRPTAGRSRSSTRAARCGLPRPTAAARTRSRTRSHRRQAGAARPAWSPDGATIAFTSGADLCVTDLARLRPPRHAEPADRSDRARLASGLAACSERHRARSSPRRPARTTRSAATGTPARASRSSTPTSRRASSPSPRRRRSSSSTTSTRAVTVTTTLRGAARDGSIRAASLGFSTQPGEYEFTVAGLSRRRSRAAARSSSRQPGTSRPSRMRRSATARRRCSRAPPGPAGGP